VELYLLVELDLCEVTTIILHFYFF